MARERQLFIRSEDAYAVISQGIGRGKQKSCFGQVRPIGESLHVFGAQAVGVDNDCERVAVKRNIGEDIEL